MLEKQILTAAEINVQNVMMDRIAKGTQTVNQAGVIMENALLL